MAGQTPPAALPIETARRTPRPARLCWFGPAGAGKTLTALKVARGLAGEAGRIVVLDTEHRASTLYADVCAFDLFPLEEPFDPLRYIEALRAVEGRYAVVIIDSASHEWAGPGGCLEHMARLTAAGPETSRAVAEYQVMPQHHQFLQALIRCPAHLIVTLRATIAYGLEHNRQGQWEPHVIALAPIQHEAFLYAFDLVGRLESVVVDAPQRRTQRVARLTITSTHYPPLYGTVWDNPDETLGRRIQAWLHAGTTSPARPSTAMVPPGAAPVSAPSQRQGPVQPSLLEGLSSAETARQGPPQVPEGLDTRTTAVASPVISRGALLQQIRAELFRQVPARNATGQAARRAVLQAAFGCDRLQELGRLPIAALGRGLRALLDRPRNSAWRHHPWDDRLPAGSAGEPGAKAVPDGARRAPKATAHGA